MAERPEPESEREAARAVPEGTELPLGSFEAREAEPVRRSEPRPKAGPAEGRRGPQGR